MCINPRTWTCNAQAKFEISTQKYDEGAESNQPMYKELTRKEEQKEEDRMSNKSTSAQF